MCPFTDDHRYRHVSCLDIDVEIEKVRYIGLLYALVDVAYFNRHSQDGEYLVGREKSIRIYRQHWDLWRKIT